MVLEVMLLFSSFLLLIMLVVLLSALLQAGKKGHPKIMDEIKKIKQQILN